MKCQSCGSEWPEGTAYCPECGAATLQGGRQAEPDPFIVSEAYGAALDMPEEKIVVTAQLNEKSLKQENPREPMGVFAFLGMQLLLLVPVVGIVMIFRWAFSKRVNLNKRNYAIATLILWFIGIAVAVVLGILFPGFYEPLWNALAVLFLVG